MRRIFQLVAVILALAMLAVPASALAACRMNGMSGMAMPECPSHTSGIASAPSADFQAPSCCGEAKTPAAPDDASRLPVMTAAAPAPAPAPAFALPPAPTSAAASSSLPPLQHRSPRALLCSFVI